VLKAIEAQQKRKNVENRIKLTCSHEGNVGRGLERKRERNNKARYHHKIVYIRRKPAGKRKGEKAGEARGKQDLGIPAGYIDGRNLPHDPRHTRSEALPLGTIPMCAMD